MKRLVYILSEPRSGSSALEYVLSTHPAFHAMGELRLLEKYIRQDADIGLSEGRCTCGQAFNQCPYWLPLLASVASALSCEPGQLRTRFPARDDQSPGLRDTVKRHLGVILASLDAREERILIDSSKHLEQLEVLLESVRGWQVDVIYLFRNPLDNFASKNKWKARTGRRERAPWRTVARWRSSNQRMVRFIEGAGRISGNQVRGMMLSYEAFTSRTEQTLLDLANFIGVDAEFSRTCNLRSLHTIAGTPSRFDRNEFTLSSRPLREKPPEGIGPLTRWLASTSYRQMCARAATHTRAQGGSSDSRVGRP